MRRLVYGLLAATVLAGGALAVAPVGWSPVCAAYEEGSVEWYLFLCFMDPPPKDPHA